ncbi:MAG: 50S ribosomal protein L15 [Candidatus Magasanikbacteria bacterium]|nr:50S ribosomal protein L15 [Candidatus Magasanikbacteria bacterium]
MLTGNSLQPKHGARKTKRVLGRGHGTGLGTTAGRGSKGQRARSGGRHGLIVFGSKSLIQSMPKLRGFKSLAKKAITITLDQLQRTFADGTIITGEELVIGDLIVTPKTRVKIVGNTKLDKKFTIDGVAISAGAKAAIEAAGGTVKTK